MLEIVKVTDTDGKTIGVAAVNTKVVLIVDAQRRVRSGHVNAVAQWDPPYRETGTPGVEATAPGTERAVSLAVQRLLANHPPHQAAKTDKGQ